MANITVSVQFTKNSGAPATGEALADIDITLRSIRKSDLDVVAIWNTENPTVEVGNGYYARQYTDGDLQVYDYVVEGEYTGATALDVDYVYGGTDCPYAVYFPEGAIEFTYTVTSSATGLPIEGVECWFATDAAFANVVWKGDTDAFGIARDVNNNLPLLDAGTYHIRCQKAGYTFTDDTEVVS